MDSIKSSVHLAYSSIILKKNIMVQNLLVNIDVHIILLVYTSSYLCEPSEVANSEMLLDK